MNSELQRLVDIAEAAIAAVHGYQGVSVAETLDAVEGLEEFTGGFITALEADIERDQDQDSSQVPDVWAYGYDLFEGCWQRRESKVYKV